MYRVRFGPRAARQFRKLPPDVQRRLDPGILALANDPRPPGCVKLSSEDALWRIRVGDFRIVYQVFDADLLVLVVKLGNRRDIYR